MVIQKDTCNGKYCEALGSDTAILCFTGYSRNQLLLILLCHSSLSAIEDGTQTRDHGKGCIQIDCHGITRLRRSLGLISGNRIRTAAIGRIINGIIIYRCITVTALGRTAADRQRQGSGVYAGGRIVLAVEQTAQKVT